MVPTPPAKMRQLMAPTIGHTTTPGCPAVLMKQITPRTPTTAIGMPGEISFSQIRSTCFVFTASSHFSQTTARRESDPAAIVANEI